MPQQVEAAEVQTVGDLFASGQLQWLEARRTYEAALDRLSGPDGSDDFVLDEFASALEQFVALGGYAVEQRIEEIKSGLGITRIPLGQPVTQLSGGEKRGSRWAPCCFQTRQSSCWMSQRTIPTFPHSCGWRLSFGILHWR